MSAKKSESDRAGLGIKVSCEGYVFEVGAAAGSVTKVGERFQFLFTYDPATPAGYQTAVEALYQDAVLEHTLELKNANTAYSGQGGRADIHIYNDSYNNRLDAFELFTKFPPDAPNFPPVNGAPFYYIQLNISNQGGTPLNSRALPASIDLQQFSNRRLTVTWHKQDCYVLATVESMVFTPVV